ncbi:hypothetical protein BJ944DRAFT_262860 [Cunninghamella echinulata]|nr:hypothetical protein BJ944DRAFT_262860 [Cunninghamella echinulata]
MQETKLIEIHDQSQLIQKWMNSVNKCLEEQWKDTNYLLYYAKKWKDPLPPPHSSQFTPGEIIHQMSKAGIRIMQKSIDLCQDLSETVVLLKKKEKATNHLNAAESNFLIFREKKEKATDPLSLSFSSLSSSLSLSSSSLSTLSSFDMDKNNYVSLQLPNRLSYFNENEPFPSLMTKKKNALLLNDSTSTIVKNKNNNNKTLYDSSSYSYPYYSFLLNNNNNNPIATNTTSVQCQDCFFCQTAMPLENNIPFYSSTTINGKYHPFMSSIHSFSSITSSFIIEDKNENHHQGISYQQQHEQFLSSLASLPSLSIDSIDDFSLPPIEIQASSFPSLKEKENGHHNKPLYDQQQSYLLNLKQSISFYFYQENQFGIFKKKKKSSSSLKGKERAWIRSWAEKLPFTSLFLCKKKNNKVHPMK